MKKQTAAALVFLAIAMAARGEESSATGAEARPAAKKSIAGVSEPPPARRPKSPDPLKAEEAAKGDEGSDAEERRRDALRYGTPSEVSELVKKLTDSEDPRFSEELYDLFHTTKSQDVRSKIFDYFASLDDPCLCDSAVEILNDPFDVPADSALCAIKYSGAVKCAEAVPALAAIVEADDDRFFNAALSALAEAGGAEEALYIAGLLEDSDDLGAAKKQSLVRALGKIKAVETFDSLSDMAKDEDENIFVRMYAAEAIGAMKKEEAVETLEGLLESGDPNLRQYAVKGLKNFPGNERAEEAVVQALKDEHVKTRLEAISAVKEMGVKSAAPSLIYRARNDKEPSVKKAAYPVIAALGTEECDSFLVEILKDKKASDNSKALVAEALLGEGRAGEAETLALARETLKDDRRKPLRYAIGKQLAKYERPSFADVCAEYLSSKDSATVGVGLDIFKKGRYSAAEGAARAVAQSEKGGSNKARARKILDMPDEAEGGEGKAAPPKKNSGAAQESERKIEPAPAPSQADAK